MSNGSSELRQRLADYWSGHAPGLVAEDAVFHELGSGLDYHGTADIDAMLHWFYNVALDARAVPKKVILDESGEAAAVAGRVVGRHIGEFAGVPATGKEINVQLCVTYAIEGDRIREAWVYFNMPEFMRQVGAAPVA